MASYLSYLIPQSVRQMAGEIWSDVRSEADSFQEEGVELAKLVKKAATVARPVVVEKAKKARAAAVSMVQEVKKIGQLPESPKTLVYIYVLLKQLGKNLTDPGLRKELARTLENFLREFSLEAADRQRVEALHNKLSSNQEIHRDDLNELGKILRPLREKHKAYIEARIERRRELEVKLQDVPGALETPAALSKEQTVELIKKELNLLSGNLTKMIIGSMVFLRLNLSQAGQVNGNRELCRLIGIDESTAKTADLTTLLMSHSGKHSPRKFTDLLREIIHHSNAGISSRIRAQFYIITSDLVESYVVAMIDQLKKGAIAFINLNSADQLREVFALFVDPLNHHLEAVQHEFTTDPELKDHLNLRDSKRIAERLAQLSERTSKHTVNTFVKAFLKQFTLPMEQEWIKKIDKFLLELGHSSLLLRLLCFPVRCLLWVFEILLYYVSKVINKGTRTALKLLITNLFPTLMNSTKKAQHIGEPFAWHSIKNNLLIKLRQLQLALLTPKNDPTSHLAQETIPGKVTASLETLIDNLKTVVDLQEPLQPRAVPFFDTALPFFGTVKSKTAHLISQQLVRENAMASMILSALQGTNANAFAPKDPVSEKDKADVEKDLSDELTQFIHLTLEDVKEDFRSDRNEQAQANSYVNKLKSLSASFDAKGEYRRTGLKNIERLETLHQNYVDELQKLDEKLLSKLDASTQALLRPLHEQAILRGNQIKLAIDQQKIVRNVALRLKKAPMTLESAEPILAKLSAIQSPETVARVQAIMRQYIVDRNDAALISSLQNLYLRKNFVLQVQNLKSWANGLAYVRTTVQPTRMDIAKAQGLGIVLAPLPIAPVANSYAKSLLGLLGQEFHLDGVIDRMMRAYTSKAPLPPEVTYIPPRKFQIATASA